MALLTEQEIKNSKRLLFMTHLALGDFVYNGVLLKALKRAYPNLVIDIWIDDCRERQSTSRKDRSDILESWIAKTGIADMIFPIANGNDDRRLAARRASKRKYDIIFYLSTRPEKFAEFAYTVSKSAIIVGNSPEGKLKKIMSFQVMRRVKHRFEFDLHTNSTHILEKYKRYYEYCFGSLSIAQEDQYGLGIALPDSAKQQAQKWLEQQDKNEHMPLVLLNPISTSKKRDLSGHTLVFLIESLLKKYPKIHIVLNVPPSSQVGVKALLKSLPALKNTAHKISIFSAHQDFFVLPALMNLCNFIVTVETSIMHIAASLNVPQMAIVRRSAAKWKPLRADHIFWCSGNISDCEEYEVTAKALSCIEQRLAEKA